MNKSKSFPNPFHAITPLRTLLAVHYTQQTWPGIEREPLIIQVHWQPHWRERRRRSMQGKYGYNILINQLKQSKPIINGGWLEGYLSILVGEVRMEQGMELGSGNLGLTPVSVVSVQLNGFQLLIFPFPIITDHISFIRVIFFIMESRPITSLIVVEHKIIDQQMAYFIVNGTKRCWVKLCEANDNQTNAILKYESDKNRGIEPGYYPEAEDNEELRALRDSHCSAGAQMKPQVKYNLRERELLLISMNDFYGIKRDDEKKQVQPKSKKEVTKQEFKAIVSQNKDYSNGPTLPKKQEVGGISKIENTSWQAGRLRKAKEGQIIDVEKVHKRKLIKKQSSGKKERCIEIEIYDGSDSELKML